MKFAASKAQLNDERMWHAFRSFHGKIMYPFPGVTEKEDKCALRKRSLPGARIDELPGLLAAVMGCIEKTGQTDI